MKKLKIILLLSLSIAYFSCEDAYKIEQDGEFQEDVTFQSIKDMRAVLNEVYDQESIYSEIAFSSIFTDEVGIGSQNTGQNLDTYKFILNRNSGEGADIWLSHYSVINNANRLIRGATRITPTAEEELEYNSILAHAKALRAFSYFQLLTYFSEDIKNNSSLGVLLFENVPDLADNVQLPRSTTGEVFALIDSDLVYAEANLLPPAAPVARKAWTYVTQNFIDAFKARMYLYRGNYVLAGQFADKVINTSGLTLAAAGTYTSTFYTTAVASPYRRMFIDDPSFQGEIIFSLARPIGKQAVAGIYYTNTTNVGGSPYHDMGRNLFNLLGPTTGTGVQDVRRRAFVDQSSRISSTYETTPDYKNLDVLCIDKYPGITGAALTNDLKVFRLSEMYFIKAEVLANAGDRVGVATILKQIRDVRTFGPGTPSRPLPVYSTIEEAWADILKERRIELCFEGHRYIDLRRLGQLAGGVSVDRYIRDCEENSVPVCSIPVTDHRFVTMPIPQSELQGNGNAQQNPGY